MTSYTTEYYGDELGLLRMLMSDTSSSSRPNSNSSNRLFDDQNNNCTSVPRNANTTGSCNGVIPGSCNGSGVIPDLSVLDPVERRDAHHGMDGGESWDGFSSDSSSSQQQQHSDNNNNNYLYLNNDRASSIGVMTHSYGEPVTTSAEMGDHSYQQRLADPARVARRRSSNRKAAKKCRDKQRIRWDDLRKTEEDLVCENTKIRHQIFTLKKERAELALLLNHHKNVCKKLRT